MSDSFSRRAWLAGVSASGAALLAVNLRESAVAEEPKATRPFKYCLNTSTIRGQNLGIVKEVEIAAAAGYEGIEPWIGTLETYVKEKGSLPDLRKRIEDAGLKVASAIGFARWIVDNDEERQQGLEQARRDMDLIAQLGGTHIAAPPVGAHDKPGPDLPTTARRYRALLEVGQMQGVVPQLEVWGFSKSLSRLGETAYVALEAGHPQACMLLDMYHLYKGGSDLPSLKLLSGAAMHCFHINDYPDKPDRAEINDSFRVYPGDGVAPLKETLSTLHQTGFRGYLSLELFNRDYWKEDPLEVAKRGLEKIRTSVSAAITSGA